MLSIIIGSDDAGFELKQVIKEHIIHQGNQCYDFEVLRNDTKVYPDIALSVANAVAAGEFERGILICGTGIGMCIVANKIAGVRAALCHDTYSAERARKSNNAQILTMGARVIGVELAKKIVDAWLGSEFEGGGSLPKVLRVDQIDDKYRKAPAK